MDCLPVDIFMLLGYHVRHRTQYLEVFFYVVTDAFVILLRLYFCWGYQEKQNLIQVSKWLSNSEFFWWEPDNERNDGRVILCVPNGRKLVRGHNKDRSGTESQEFIVRRIKTQRQFHKVLCEV